MKRRRALLGSNPSRNSRLETHSDGQGADRNWPAPATRRLPTNIGVDLPIPQKPTLTTARWSPVWRDNFVT